MNHSVQTGSQLRFAVTAATYALPGAPVLLRGDTREQFAAAKKLGYDAVELHLRTPEVIPAEELVLLQEEFGVRVSAVATGLAALVDHLCFISPDAQVRAAAVERIKAFIDWCAIVRCSIVLGSLRGNLPRDDTRAQAEEWIRKALTTLTAYAEQRDVTLLLEVINRYENNYLNTAAETIEFVRSFHSEHLKVHLDTFHMNIEEANMAKAIRDTGAMLGYLHLADNNRHACGEGCLDFKAVLQALKDIGYTGYASVECLPLPDGYTAAENSLAYLKALC